MQNPRSIAIGFAVALAAMSLAPPALADGFIPVHGGPGTGYFLPALPFAPGSTAGNGVATLYSYKGGGTNVVGTRAFRWDASGSPPIELGNLGTSQAGVAFNFAYAVNSAGTIIGYADKYVGNTAVGERAVRWDSSGTVATELDHLGLSNSGSTSALAYVINDAGVAAGTAEKWVGGTNLGSRAVRWDASGTAITELEQISTRSDGDAFSRVYAINNAGTAVGRADQFSGDTYLGVRAVRWDASGAATELSHLGTRTDGYAFSVASGLNEVGTAVGYAEKYAGVTRIGDRAVRWEASGSAATELANLGTSSSGGTESRAYAINSAGTAVGYSNKYAGGVWLGSRAVRWDASGSAATELANLGTSSSGRTESQAHAINSAGATVGYAEKFVGGTSQGFRAMLWGTDGVAINLNTLIDPASGWTLLQANDISDTNWVTGVGRFDLGESDPYDRAFLLNVSSIVPEPSALALLAVGGLVLSRRRS